MHARYSFRDRIINRRVFKILHAICSFFICFPLSLSLSLPFLQLFSFVQRINSEYYACMLQTYSSSTLFRENVANFIFVSLSYSSLFRYLRCTIAIKMSLSSFSPSYVTVLPSEIKIGIDDL